MKQEDHEAKALATFGRKYTFIHEFLDQYFPDFGPYHRIILHHQRGIDLIKAAFPQEDHDMIQAVAEQHIRDDQNGLMPYDWREFAMTVDEVDRLISEITQKPPRRLIKKMREFFPEDF